MLLIEYISKQPKYLIIATGAALVLILGIIDYRTGPDVSFLVFYLVPVMLVTWFAGGVAGIVMSLASAVFWFLDDVLGRSLSTHPAVPYWNAAMKFVVFLILTNILLVLKNTLEREKLSEQAWIKRELEIAREVQTRLFPQVLPQMKTLEYSALCRSAYAVGGDYYDFIPISNGYLAIVLADVSGKGISSALLMANLQAALRSRVTQKGDKIPQLLGQMNDWMRDTTDHNRFATVVYGVYDDSVRTFTYVNAGHNPPILFQQHQRILRLTQGGTVIGLIKDPVYHAMTMPLAPGDVLVLFTDGVTEAMNLQEEEFGEERLITLVTENLNLCPQALCDLIVNQVDQFVGSATQHDDLTLLVMKVR